MHQWPGKCSFLPTLSWREAFSVSSATKETKRTFRRLFARYWLSASSSSKTTSNNNCWKRWIWTVVLSDGTKEGLTSFLGNWTRLRMDSAVYQGTYSLTRRLCSNPIALCFNLFFRFVGGVSGAVWEGSSLQQALLSAAAPTPWLQAGRGAYSVHGVAGVWHWDRCQRRVRRIAHPGQWRAGAEPGSLAWAHEWGGTESNGASGRCVVWRWTPRWLRLVTGRKRLFPRYPGGLLHRTKASADFRNGWTLHRVLNPLERGACRRRSTNVDRHVFGSEDIATVQKAKQGGALDLIRVQVDDAQTVPADHTTLDPRTRSALSSNLDKILPD